MGLCIFLIKYCSVIATVSYKKPKKQNKKSCLKMD